MSVLGVFWGFVSSSRRRRHQATGNLVEAVASAPVGSPSRRSTPRQFISHVRPSLVSAIEIRWFDHDNLVSITTKGHTAPAVQWWRYNVNHVVWRIGFWPWAPPPVSLKNFWFNYTTLRTNSWLTLDSTEASIGWDLLIMPKTQTDADPVRWQHF